MKRSFAKQRFIPPCMQTRLLHRPAKNLRKESEAILRDMAYVLQLIYRIKEELREEKQETASLSRPSVTVRQ